jgi:hypothetical protein
MFTFLITATQFDWVGDYDFLGLSAHGYYEQAVTPKQVLFSTDLINFTDSTIGSAFDAAFYNDATNKDILYKFGGIEPYRPPSLSAIYDYDTASFTKMIDES